MRDMIPPERPWDTPVAFPEQVSPAPRPDQKPKDLVFTLFGEYLLTRSESVWVGSLISLLTPFGLTDGGLRTALSRMAKKGWLSGERIGKNAFYALTPMGRDLLEEGQRRIYHPSWSSEWDGSWFLLAYSIPQDARRARDRLRDRLAWLGFGSIGNGLWISPHDVATEIRDLSARLDLGEHLVCFRAETVEEDDATLVQRGWDLNALDEAYRRFIGDWSEVGDELRRTETDGPLDGKRSYAQRFNLIHEFRRFTLDDPFLPRGLLPTDWAGDPASRLFLDVHDRLAGPADAYVEAVLDIGANPSN
jgi:phenylacetic acid degradation operon negative regulatory protein